MADHYYTNKPSSQQAEKMIDSQVGGLNFRFLTDAGVFSKDRVDFGSRLLLESFKESYPSLEASKLFYEFGSGYGPISIVLGKFYPAAHVRAVELNERALNLAKRNAHLNDISNIEWQLGNVEELTFEESADYVLTNPPIRAGKQVIQAFVTQAYQALKKEGELWLVIQKKQGAPSMEKFMEEVFGEVELKVRSKGYWILVAKK